MKALRLLANGLTPLILLGGLVAVGAWVGRASNAKRLRAERESEQQIIATVPVTVGDFGVVVEMMGALEAVNSVPVMAEVSGQLLRLVPNGVKVKQGEVIAVLDVPRMVRDLVRYQAQYQDALARYESRKRQLAADVERAKISLDQATRELERFRASQQANLTNKRAQTQFESQVLGVSRERFARKEKLAAEALLPKREVELATADIKAKEFGLERGRKDLELAEAKKSSDELDKQAAVDRAKAELERAESAQRFELQSQMMNLQINEQQLMRVQEQLAKAEVRAPTDGIVVLEQQRQFRGPGAQRAVEPGDPVWEGMKIATVPDLSTMRVLLELPQEQARLVRRGQKALVQVAGLPGKSFTGEVVEMSQTAKEPSMAGMGIPAGERVFEARVELITGAGPRRRPTPSPPPIEAGEGARGPVAGGAWSEGAAPLRVPEGGGRGAERGGAGPGAGGRGTARGGPSLEAAPPPGLPEEGRRPGGGRAGARSEGPPPSGLSEGGGRRARRAGEDQPEATSEAPAPEGAGRGGRRGGASSEGASASRVPGEAGRRRGARGGAWSEGPPPSGPPEGGGRGARGAGDQPEGVPEPRPAEGAARGGRAGGGPEAASPPPVPEGGATRARGGWSERASPSGLPGAVAHGATGGGSRSGGAAALRPLEGGARAAERTVWLEPSRPSRVAQAPTRKDSQDTGLRPGMTSMVRIIVERLPNAISVPLECVFEREERKVVYVQRNGRFGAVEVDLGPQNEDMVVVTRGLKAGDRIALRDIGQRGGERTSQRQGPQPSELPL